MPRWPVSLLACFIPWLGCAACAMAQSGAAGRGSELAVPRQPDLLVVPAAVVSAAIDDCASYLCQHIDEEGRFDYLVSIGDTGGVSTRSSTGPEYNMLRHAGAIYALACYAQRTDRRMPSEIADADRPELPQREPDASANLVARPLPEAPLRAAGEFLLRQIGSVPQQPEDLLAVWSRPAITGSRSPAKAKLGGAGLALVALTRLQQLGLIDVHQETFAGLARFVLFLQRPDGSFFPAYRPDLGRPEDDWSSLYYPGEAALGLLMLHERQPDERWVASAVRALTRLARSRSGLDEAEVPADHWALLATQQLLSQPAISLAADDRELLLEHARQICRSILKSQRLDSSDLQGAFDEEGRTAPVATRLEGLLSALAFLPPQDRGLRTDIDQACHHGIRFLLRAQITQGPNRGGIRGAVPTSRVWKAQPTSAVAQTIRIDYVQHALSALMQYEVRYHPEIRFVP